MPQKPLSDFEQKMLKLVLDKLKPTIDAAIAKAEAKLREDIGPEGLSKIDKLGADIDKLLKDGPPPLTANAKKILAGAVAILVGIGLYQRAKS